MQESKNVVNANEVKQDVPQQLDLDLGMFIEKLDSWVDGLVRLVPNIITAVIVLLLFYFLGKFFRKLVIGRANKRSRDNLGEVLGGLVKWVAFVIGFLLAATIVIPTLKAGDLIAGMGVSSVAIGFAFKDILQNWLAGLLILLRQPFEIGDQIEVNGFEGTVKRIETRATIIKTYDGQRIVVPNSDIYTNAVLVKTAHDLRRSQYDIGIGYADGIEDAQEVIIDAIKGIDGIESDPAPEALPWDLAASWVTIRARWWTDSKRADVVQVRAKVIMAVKSALDNAGIDMPYETYQQLLHDQTEDIDGDRNKQREGWPADKKLDPKPRWRVKQENLANSDDSQQTA